MPSPLNPNPTPEQIEAMGAGAAKMFPPKPTPLEAAIVRAYDSGVYESAAEMAQVIDPGRNYAKVLDNFRPQWRTEPWRDAMRWHINRIGRRRSRRSAEWVSRVLRRFEAYRAGRELTPAMIDGWLGTLTSASPASLNRWSNCMRTYLRDLNAMGWLPSPLEHYMTILAPLREAPKAPEVLSPDQVRALLKASTTMTRRGANGTRLFVLISLILGTRPGETLLLRGQDILTRKRMVNVPPFKRSAQRRISYKTSPSGVELFEFLREHRADNDPLCIATLNTFSWKRLLGLAGLPVFDRRILRATARSAYSASPILPESNLRRMFGHGTDVADRHYIDDGSEWDGDGECIEQILGCEAEMAAAVQATIIRERTGRPPVIHHKLPTPIHYGLHPVLAKQV